MLLLTAFGNTPVLTSVPEDLCHPGEDFLGDHSINEKSLLAQRIKSWDCTAHRFFFKYLKHFFLYWNTKTILLKLYYLHEILTIIQDYLRILVIVYFVYLRDLSTLGLIAFRVLEIQYILFLVFNYWTLRRRRDLRAPLIIILIFPLYRLLLLIFRVVAMFYNLFEYLPRSRNFSRLVEDPSRLPPYHPVLHSLIQKPRDWHRVWNPNEFEVDEDQNVKFSDLSDSDDDFLSSGEDSPNPPVDDGIGLSDVEGIAEEEALPAIESQNTEEVNVQPKEVQVKAVTRKREPRKPAHKKRRSSRSHSITPSDSSYDSSYDSFSDSDDSYHHRRRRSDSRRHKSSRRYKSSSHRHSSSRSRR
ncbi:hypothetical protein RCL1_003599 [Eukaryota sp. TZLM3-RCL]